MELWGSDQWDYQILREPAGWRVYPRKNYQPTLEQALGDPLEILGLMWWPIESPYNNTTQYYCHELVVCDLCQDLDGFWGYDGHPNSSCGTAQQAVEAWIGVRIQAADSDLAHALNRVVTTRRFFQELMPARLPVGSDGV
jgi:hypothetical protein